MTAPALWTPYLRPDGQYGIRYSLHAGQKAAWRSEARITAMLAGTQSGKTSFLPLWLQREIRRRGPGDYIAATSTYDLFKLKLLPEFIRYYIETLGVGTYLRSDKVIQFSNEPTRIILRSAANPESLESATAKGAVLDEAGQDQFPLAAWEAIQRRLALYEGRVLIGTTLYNLGWVKQRIFDPWLAGDPDMQVIQFPSIMNPVFPRAEYDRAARTLADWKFAMFYQGRYHRPPGLIYSDFDSRYREQGGHRVRAFAIPPEWPRHVGVDPGAVNTAVVYLAEDPAAHVFYVYRETLEGGKTSAEHAAGVLAALDGVNAGSLFGGAKSEVQARLDWAAANVPIIEPPIADVEAGIDRVIAAIKLRRLYVFDTCAGVLDQLGTYSRVVDDAGRVTEAIQDKAAYHYLDALRYVVQGAVGDPVSLFAWGGEQYDDG